MSGGVRGGAGDPLSLLNSRCRRRLCVGAHGSNVCSCPEPAERDLPGEPRMENYVSANDESRERLGALVERLTDDDLALELGAGWTVGAVLAHLAFWDQRGLSLLARKSHAGIGPSPIDADAVNDAGRPLLRRPPPAAVRDLLLDSAVAIDAAIAQLPPSPVVDIREHATHLHLGRAIHRNVHFDEIEARVGERKRDRRCASSERGARASQG